MSWLKKNYWEILILLIILSLAAFFRFYNLFGYMTFLGDEGRDALVMKRILVDHDYPLLGPPTSVGNMYLGPLYYYMMTVPNAIFNLNPVSSASMVAVIGILTVGLIYYLEREWFGKLAAMLASILYAISPVNIVSSRSSWNPNPAPFFALLSILGFYQARKSKNFLWFILTGISLAFAVQMHYLAFILLPVFFIFWLYELLSQNNKHYKNFKLGTFLTLLSFGTLMSPLFIFDLKYNFMNFRALTTLFTSQNEVSFNLFQTFTSVIPIFADKLVGRYMVGGDLLLAIPVAILIILSLRRRTWPVWALGIWLIVGLIGLSFYRQDIYDHYLGFLNPVPYLLLGGLVSSLKGKWQISLFLVLLLILGYFNLVKNPLLIPPGNQLQRTQEIAKFVIEQSNNKPFNFALIAKRNYDSAYQFYLWLYGHEPKVVPGEITDQLFVVCEDATCEPINNAKFEIAGYGWAKIDQEITFNGIKVYKLIPNPSGK